MATAKRLLVCGGTGFLGRRICEFGVAHGWEVTCLSRSGINAFRNAPSGFPAWASEVRFVPFDLSTAASPELDKYVSEADAVAYSLGILLESTTYKTVAASAAPLDGVQNAWKMFNRNPLKHKIEESVTYDLMNRDLAIKLADATARSADAAVVEKPFLYVSAAGNFPLVPSGYFRSKREAEEAISKMRSLRPIFLRPGFMFDPSRPMSMTVAIGLKALGSVNDMLGGNVPLISSDSVKPLSTSVVAAAAIQAIEDVKVTGIVDRSNIVDLAVAAAQGRGRNLSV
ncbi:uncharacterized protein V1518DRAFT_419778 [Limtongia smithiae]|uniref:uncharacterized protein n=1 Tax=Limtongia smithiae TaxID=1125753 RepID=UPI0034CD27F3